MGVFGLLRCLPTYIPKYTVVQNKQHKVNFRCKIYTLSPKATVTLVLVWKQGVSKLGILKSLVSHFLNFKSWIKLIYDTVDAYNFVINEFNPTFEVQNMGNEAFQNASFGNTSFPNEALSYSCLWAMSNSLSLE